MTGQNTIQDELKSLGSHLPLIQRQPFAVPGGYFEALPDRVLAKVKAAAAVKDELEELSPLLGGIPKSMPFSVPASYFDESLGAVAREEADPVLSILADSDKAMPYTVPGGYFEALPAQVMATLAPPKARVVPLFARTWMRVAAAAVIAGALFVAGLQFFGVQKNDDVVAQSPAQPNPGYVAQNKAAIEKEIKQLPTRELEEFIQNVPVTAAATPKKPVASKTGAEELLKDVSVNEMESFLSALPVADEEMSLTN